MELGLRKKERTIWFVWKMVQNGLFQIWVIQLPFSKQINILTRDKVVEIKEMVVLEIIRKNKIHANTYKKLLMYFFFFWIKDYPLIIRWPKPLQ